MYATLLRGASRAVVLLATKGTCSEGIDLSGGTHVVLSQPSWNPMQDRQLVGRSVRPGQKGHVFVHRLICARTFEEKIHREAERLVRLLFSPRKLRGDQTPDGSRVQVAENPLGADQSLSGGIGGRDWRRGGGSPSS
ncbi:DNA repair and recombination protein RAD54 and RAD54-like protein [Klebsormidium nitens]|uniref:DNA repair and recombination protein RAD54 and RAD54-like protein n=1 Tax=Klebsormidium nitens TaxID=105231 RepID=A0A1Y1HR09_KLENI|nr:DNA repair and recombination protein RAD54 and RAD54-like protein [Klebsormidium nitens]|eukprot:GAQ80523.1 DNA repair and recombination protein RAD54 and RAD54-like protein [Klebsormidium nitens]